MLKLNISKKANINYLAKVVNITEFSKHPNPEVTKMKVAHIGGYSISVGINEPEGFYVYFPTMSQIHSELLQYLNLYSNPEMNRDATAKPGFFDKNGRVKAIKLKGFPSEGFLLPYEHFNNWVVDSVNQQLPEPVDGLEFDEVTDGNKSFWVCRKYIVRQQSSTHPYDKRSKYDKNLGKFDKIIENQFRFHYETEMLRKNPTVIKPNDIIQISSKWHGTSAISAYILCNKPLNWKEKIAKWLTKYTFPIYDHIYASRKVIKNQYINPKVNNGYYGSDDFRVIADKFLQPYMSRGLSLYYEIVGYTTDNKYIQKEFDYGCRPIKEGESYTEGVHYKIYIYRITYTNVDGVVQEFSARAVQNWCNKNGLHPVIELYYGYAKDLYPDLNIEEHWNENFLERLANDKNFYMEERSPDCANNVPHEGVVIRIEDNLAHSFKLKCFSFLSKEQKALDKGETNIEDEI